MDTHTYIISKDRPYFNIPVLEGKEGIVFTRIIPEAFSPTDDLQVIIRSEQKANTSESSVFSLLGFIDHFGSAGEFIPFTDLAGKRYLMVSVLLGKKDNAGNFIPLEKLDPDKIGDIKILLEYRFQKAFRPEYARV